jgi:hypothetical protein
MGAVDPGKVDRSLRGPQQAVFNVDGAVRDEDVFVVGDEDGDEQTLETSLSDGEAVQIPGPTAPPNTLPTELTRHPELDVTGTPHGASEEPPDDKQAHPGRYYIRPDDTLLGISLRLGINVGVVRSSISWSNRIAIYQGRILCKLNDLPPSTLNTTPYLLHTRAFLVLPESHSQHATSVPSAQEDARETRVRAGIALQRVTKETDWGVVQAYVALAEDSDLEPDITSLKFEGEKPRSGSEKVPRRTLEERAVDWYLDDDEWERENVNMNTRARV